VAKVVAKVAARCASYDWQHGSDGGKTWITAPSRRVSVAVKARAPRVGVLRTATPVRARQALGMSRGAPLKDRRLVNSKTEDVAAFVAAHPAPHPHDERDVESRTLARVGARRTG